MSKGERRAQRNTFDRVFCHFEEHSLVFFRFLAGKAVISVLAELLQNILDQALSACVCVCVLCAKKGKNVNG
jgi:hypothetical protein